LRSAISFQSCAAVSKTRKAHAASKHFQLENPKPGFQVQIVLAGMDRQRRTIDKLHDQVRLTVFGDAAVQEAGDAEVPGGRE
jgi:hypothetical protein